MIKVVYADVLNGLREIKNGSIDLLIIDPPYGTSKISWDIDNLKIFTEKYWSECFKKLKQSGSAYVFWSQKEIKIGLDIFKPKRIIIWYHKNLAKYMRKGFIYKYENVFYITKSERYTFNDIKDKVKNYRNDVKTYTMPQTNFVEDKKYYDCQKPLDLIKELILISSNKGDLILDPFCGSGTVLVVSKILSRNCIGIDDNKKAIKITNKD